MNVSQCVLRRSITCLLGFSRWPSSTVWVLSALVISAVFVSIAFGAGDSLASDSPVSSPAQTFGEGKKYLESGQLQKAQEVWQPLFPDSLYGSVALLLLSRAFLDKGHPEKAEALLRVFMERHNRTPYRDKGRELLIEALVRQQKPEARDMITSLLEASPEKERAPLILKLAQLERHLGNYQAAVIQYRKLLVQYPASVEGLKAGEDIAWMVVHGKIPRLMLSEEEQLARAGRLYAQGRFDLAEEAYRAVLKAKPTDTHLLLKVAQCRFRARRNEEALATLKDILKKELPQERRCEALHTLSLVYWRLDRDKEFEQTCNKILQIGTPAFKRRALFQLAAHALEKRQLDKAKEFYTKYLQAGPEESSRNQVMFKLAWIDYLSGRYVKAAEGFQKARHASASGRLGPAGSYWQACSLMRAKRTKEAEHLFRELAQRAPFDYYSFLAAQQLKALGITLSPSQKALRSFPSIVLNETHRAYPQVAAAEKLLEAGVPEFAFLQLKALHSSVKILPPVAFFTARVAYAAERYDEAYRIVHTQFGSFVEAPSESTPREFLEIAYPRVFLNEVVALGQKYGVDPLLVWGVMRQESQYDPGLVSPAGALGLMQVTPGAAGFSSVRQRPSSHIIAEILEPKKNLVYGIRELGKNLKNFKGKVIPAVAAYNADIKKVKTWVRANGHLRDDEFVETIPYLETRLYVKKVMAGYRAYAEVYRKKGLVGLW